MGLRAFQSTSHCNSLIPLQTLSCKCPGMCCTTRNNSATSVCSCLCQAHAMSLSPSMSFVLRPSSHKYPHRDRTNQPPPHPPLWSPPKIRPTRKRAGATFLRSWSNRLLLGWSATCTHSMINDYAQYKLGEGKRKRKKEIKHFLFFLFFVSKPSVLCKSKIL